MRRDFRRPVTSVLDVDARVRLELEQFFSAAVALEGKELKILGWGGADDALMLARAAVRKAG